jgi:hypothetical protein
VHHTERGERVHDRGRRDLVAVADPALTSVEVRHLGGALARPAPGGGAQPSIDANYLLVAVGISPTPDLAAAVRAQAQAVKDAFAPWRVGYDYYNSEETPAPASGVLPLASYRRLQKIKAAYDPDQAIISAHPVWPTRAGEVAPRPVREIKVPKHWTERSVVPAPQPTPRASPP